MKKKALLLASMGVLSCTFAVTALVVGGANQLDRLQVKASPMEYSITFTESNTTVEADDDDYAIGTTTASGNKVGVVGFDNSEASFTFHGVSFGQLWLYDYVAFVEFDAYQFSTITGFAISFSSESEEVELEFTSFQGHIQRIASGTPYEELSITPDDSPRFVTFGEGNVIVSSLTIWYSC